MLGTVIRQQHSIVGFDQERLFLMHAVKFCLELLLKQHVRVLNLAGLEQVALARRLSVFREHSGRLQFDRALRGPRGSLSHIRLLLTELLKQVCWQY